MRGKCEARSPTYWNGTVYRVPRTPIPPRLRTAGLGGPLYVIIASAGVDTELEKVILAATARHRGSTCGIWVLAERDASDLIRYSSAH